MFLDSSLATFWKHLVKVRAISSVMEETTLGNVLSSAIYSDDYEDVEKIAGICARSDVDGDVGIYTFHLVGILGMAALCIIGNALVIFIMTKECNMTQPLNCFIVSLACSDLLQGLVYAVYNISHLNVPLIRSFLGKYVSQPSIISTQVLNPIV